MASGVPPRTDSRRFPLFCSSRRSCIAHQHRESLVDMHLFPIMSRCSSKWAISCAIVKRDGWNDARS